MRLFENINPLRAYIRSLRSGGNTCSIGFVPTMGALHEGHLSLIRKAGSDNDIVVVSIFVNPIQFAPNEDLSAYPRPLMRDQQMCQAANTDALFLPSASEIYPNGFQTIVDVPGVASVLEGACRPSHFKGVATVVLKLLNIVQPDRLYLGQKDYQQALVLERMALDLNVAADIVTVPTVRDQDGVALSSRNAYLSAQERSAAGVLRRSLDLAEERVAAGETDAAALQREMCALIADEPLTTIDYVSLVHPLSLAPAASLKDAVTLAALAVRIGKTRLIDNALIAPPGVPNVRPRMV